MTGKEYQEMIEGFAKRSIDEMNRAIKEAEAVGCIESAKWGEGYKDAFEAILRLSDASYIQE